MTTFDLNNWKEEENSTSDFFKIPVGETKLRVLTDFVKVETIWENGKPVGKYTGQELSEDQTVSKKGWAWCEIDGELKIVQMPVSIIGQLAQYKADPEYAWDEMPMPYDITIKREEKNSPKMYSCVPARQNTPVSEETMDKLKEATPIEEILERIEEKRNETAVEYPESEGEPLI